MPSNPRKSAETWLAVAGVAIALIGVIGWRSLSGAAVPLAALPQTADLDALAKYLTPVPPVPPVAPVVSSTSSASGVVASRAGVQRDPFAAPAAELVASIAHADSAPAVAAPAAGTWIVNAVLITDSYRAAIINDALVTLGNRLSDGTRLTAVERDHVVLTDAQGTKRIITVRDGIT